MADTGFARGPAFFGTFLETNVRLYSVDRTGRRRASLGELGKRLPDHVTFSDGLAARFGLPVQSTTPRAGQRVDNCFCLGSYGVKMVPA